MGLGSGDRFACVLHNCWQKATSLSSKLVNQSASRKGRTPSSSAPGSRTNRNSRYRLNSRASASIKSACVAVTSSARLRFPETCLLASTQGESTTETSACGGRGEARDAGSVRSTAAISSKNAVAVPSELNNPRHGESGTRLLDEGALSMLKTLACDCSNS